MTLKSISKLNWNRIRMMKGSLLPLKNPPRLKNLHRRRIPLRLSELTAFDSGNR